MQAIKKMTEEPKAFSVITTTNEYPTIDWQDSLLDAASVQEIDLLNELRNFIPQLTNKKCCLIQNAGDADAELVNRALENFDVNIHETAPLIAEDEAYRQADLVVIAILDSDWFSKLAARKAIADGKDILVLVPEWNIDSEWRQLNRSYNAAGANRQFNDLLIRTAAARTPYVWTPISWFTTLEVKEHKNNVELDDILDYLSDEDYYRMQAIDPVETLVINM